MTKKEMKRFQKAKKHEKEIRAFYASFAAKNGFQLTDFELVEDDIFGDGVPRCVTVFKKNGK